MYIRAFSVHIQREWGVEMREIRIKRFNELNIVVSMFWGCTAGDFVCHCVWLTGSMQAGILDKLQSMQLQININLTYMPFLLDILKWCINHKSMHSFLFSNYIQI